MFERCFILILFAALHITGFTAPPSTYKDSTTVIFKLDNGSHSKLNVDSVYMIFDKYDRSGAGVVMQFFYPVDNTIKVTVPKGKYYVNIICVGAYKNECFEKIITAKSDKENRFQLNVKDADLFTPGLAFIPEEKVDFANLSITKNTFSNH